MNRNERRELIAYARKVLKTDVQDVEFPGGKTRDSLRLLLPGGKTVIGTRRKSSDRANREAEVLRGLQAFHAPVPKIHGFNGKFMLQQDLGARRLSQLLHEEAPALPIETQLDKALTAMTQCHQAAKSAGLDQILPVIGGEDDWIGAFAAVPYELGGMIDITPPPYPVDKVAQALKITQPSFVKWDARPGNALIDDTGQCFWFDWEHCGLRNAADDFVWLMADEFVTYDQAMEARLLAKHLDAFATDGSRDETESYIKLVGVLHTCVRLQLVFKNKGKGDWWSLTKCLEGDKVGIVRRCCRRLVWRAAAWADNDARTRPLVPWFQRIEAHIEAI